jgi:hypothetical protein
MSKEEKLTLGYSQNNNSIVCCVCGLRFMPTEPNQKVCKYCKSKTRNLDVKTQPSTKKSDDWRFIKAFAVIGLTLALIYVMDYIINNVAKITPIG